MLVHSEHRAEGHGGTGCPGEKRCEVPTALPELPPKDLGEEQSDPEQRQEKMKMRAETGDVDQTERTPVKGLAELVLGKKRGR